MLGVVHLENLMLEVDVNEHFEIFLLTDIYTHMDNVDDRYDQMIPNAADMLI